MNEDVAQDVNLVMQQIYSDPKGEKGEEPYIEGEIIHVHHFPDALVIIKEPGNFPSTNIPVVESIPKDAAKNQPSMFVAYFVVTTFIFFTLSNILFQLYLLFHPPTTTIILLLDKQQISLNGTLPLGRVFPPITLSLSQTGATTGHGHQDAKEAYGTITFYNGELHSVTVPGGTMLTGNDGIQISTDQDADIPPESRTIPPTLGQTIVSAHAVSPGSGGNIPTGDINQSCCHTSILAQNTAPFHGGQDERDFTVVTRADINNVSTELKTTLSQSMQGALQGQLKNMEALVPPTCIPTVTSDRQIGQEATAVKVTISETCSGIAYNKDALQAQATQLLTSRANQKLGTDYSLLGSASVTITRSFLNKTQVSLTFSCKGNWIYVLSHASQEHIKSQVAGKT